MIKSNLDERGVRGRAKLLLMLPAVTDPIEGEGGGRAAGPDKVPAPDPHRFVKAMVGGVAVAPKPDTSNECCSSSMYEDSSSLSCMRYAVSHHLAWLLGCSHACSRVLVFVNF